MVLQRGFHPRPDLEPLASEVGPFPRHAFLSAWLEELGQEVDVATIDNPDGHFALMRGAKGWEFLGEPDLTDYHSPLGTDLKQTVAESLELGEPIVFDSVPQEAADALSEALAAAGKEPVTSQHEVAMVLELPPTLDRYFEALTKKDRHELRRKRRRYEEVVGSVAHRTDDPDGFDEFARLHRLAPGEKGEFMTGERRRFFARLSRLEGWQVDSLVDNSGRTIAALFGWSDGRGYYLYNSAFDPAFQSASPGLVVLLSMIEVAIEAGLTTFDFLKGDEDYKVRLGAKPRPLYQVTVT